MEFRKNSIEFFWSHENRYAYTSGEFLINVFSWKLVGNDNCLLLLQTGDNGLLSIDEVERDDSAQFKCVAVNPKGESDVWVTNITVMGQYAYISFTGLS